MVRYDPRNLSKVYVATAEGGYHPIPYADLGLPPITLWEQRAALAQLRAQADATPGEAMMFKAVLEQRALVARSASRTKAARRRQQRQKDAAVATIAASTPACPAVDYSQPAEPSDAEIWSD